jgi:multiple sugar transport system permease protein
MQNTSVAPTGTWDVTPTVGSHGRHTAGRALILIATLALLAVAVMQGLHVFWDVGPGFTTWRPLLYAYVVWAAALCAGLVLSRGESGRRALFVLPAILFTLAMVIFPTIFGLYIAFTDWNLSAVSGRRFSGLDNLRRLFSDGGFWQAMGNMVFYVASVLVQYAIAFGLALLLNQNIRGRKFFRVAFLLPFMLSPVAVSWMIGKSIMELRYGPASMLARELGWDTPAFFATPWVARTSIVALDAWYTIPFVMVLLLAGLQALPGEIMESARVDGARAWQAFWHMTFPLMLPVSVTAIVLRIIFQLKLADIVLTVTGGAPGGATDTVSSFIFREYNTRSNVGYGTALAQFYLVVIIVFILVLLSLISRWMRRFT